MPRPDKVATVTEVRDELRANAATLLTEYRGLTVSDMAELRRELRAAGASYVVVKNTLAKIAADEAGLEGLGELLVGPTALAFCESDPVEPSKVLRRFAKTHPALVVKGGLMEGAVLDAAAAGKLADLESREELLGGLARLMYGLLSKPAQLLQAPLTQIARLAAALQDKASESAPADAAS